jgi:hypothetical protein
VFNRVAINDSQIEHWNLPTRPTKTTGNRHAKGWKSERPSVELDALPPSELRALARDCIETHVDLDRLARLRQIEDEERGQLMLFRKMVADGDRP